MLTENSSDDLECGRTIQPTVVPETGCLVNLPPAQYSMMTKTIDGTRTDGGIAGADSDCGLISRVLPVESNSSMSTSKRSSNSFGISITLVMEDKFGIDVVLSRLGVLVSDVAALKPRILRSAAGIRQFVEGVIVSVVLSKTIALALSNASDHRVLAVGCARRYMPKSIESRRCD